MNPLLRIAKDHGRDYVTPEDITQAWHDGHIGDAANWICNADARVRRDKICAWLCQLIGAGVGTEDQSLCAFIAFNGSSDIQDWAKEHKILWD